MKINESPLMKVVVLFSLGIIAGKGAVFSLPIILTLALFVFLSTILLIRTGRENAANYFLSVFIFLLGVGSITFHLKNLPEYALPEGEYRNALVYGTIENIELPRDRGVSFYLNADSLIAGGRKSKTSGKVLSKIYGKPYELKNFYEKSSAGNYVKIKCKFFRPRDKRNPGEFDYRDYLKEKGITAQASIYKTDNISLISNRASVFKNTMFKIRESIAHEIDLIYTGERRHFIKALLLGERKDLDKSIVSNFINSGIVHVLAVSGLHVGFIVAIFFIIFGRFNLFLKGGLTVAGIIIFMFISGLHPSVIRASIMAVLMILALLSGRKYSSFNVLALAALILLVINPSELFSPGFQLSFAAVFSILLFYPSFERYLNSFNVKSKFVKSLLQLFLLTFAAQLGTLPITLIYFKKLSLISFFINLIAVPLIGVIVAFAVASLAFSVISTYLGALIATTNSLLIDIMFYMAKLSGNMEFSYLRIRNFNLWEALFYYALLIVIYFSFTKFNSLKSKVSILILSILVFFTYGGIISPPFLKTNKLYVIAIDIGQGDSFLLRFPDKTAALIDAGNATKHFDNGKYVIEPLLNFLGIDKIDYLFISHVDADHYRGSLSLIRDGLVKQVYKPVIDKRLAKDVAFEKFVESYNVPIGYYSRRKFSIGGASLFFLNDTSLIKYKKFSQNNKSGLLKLCYGNESFLFTGDLEKTGENLWCGLYGKFLRSEVLKVGHHGSKSSTGERFLKLVKPKYALISAGENNKFGHPNFETLRILNKFGVEIKRTDKSGAIVLGTDGKKIEFINWKN